MVEKPIIRCWVLMQALALSNIPSPLLNLIEPNDGDTGSPHSQPNPCKGIPVFDTVDGTTAPQKLKDLLFCSKIHRYASPPTSFSKDIRNRPIKPPFPTHPKLPLSLRQHLDNIPIVHVIPHFVHEVHESQVVPIRQHR